MDEGRTTAVVVSSIGGAPAKQRCLTRPVGTWASLPLDLLLDIFCRLESTAVIRCAAACRPWRRAIIGNASFLRPRPDRFLPSLLLGVFHGYGHYHPVELRRTPGPLQSTFPLAVAAGYSEAACSFIPAAAAAAAGKSQLEFCYLVSSRDGFILLKGKTYMGDLCLCSPITGDCTFVPAATIVRYCTYILLTGNDLSLTDDYADELAVRILAVEGSDMIWSKENRIRYQLFSFTAGRRGGAGDWGPVRRSVELQQGFWVLTRSGSTAVCHDVVHWLGGPRTGEGGFTLTWTVALEVHTGRTWITELPQKIHVNRASSSLLATTGDGRLSLIRSLTGHQIQVWVVNAGDQWSLQQTVDVQKQLLHFHLDSKFSHTSLTAFCPRSGCVLAVFGDHEIRIDLGSGPCPRVECIGKGNGCACKPYEMDWSTYISKMKRF